jgi:hypothetical protein
MSIRTRRLTISRDRAISDHRSRIVILGSTRPNTHVGSQVDSPPCEAVGMAAFVEIGDERME